MKIVIIKPNGIPLPVDIIIKNATIGVKKIIKAKNNTNPKTN